MTATADTTVDATIHGHVNRALLDTLVEKTLRTAEHSREDVHRVDARLTQEPKPGRRRPAIAEVTLDVDGSPVRAHVAAETMSEAIDLVVDRLARRLEHHEARRHHLADRHRTGVSPVGEWRHGDLKTERPEFAEIPFDDREIRRRKSFPLPPMTVEEAIFDLEQLGHDFYLFVEKESGLDAVVSHGPASAADERFEIRSVDPSSLPPDIPVAGVRVVPTSAPTLDIGEAAEFLEASGESFLFHRPDPQGRGQVLYRRYDGHHGLITPG